MHPMVMLLWVKMPCLLTVSQVLTTRGEHGTLGTRSNSLLLTPRGRYSYLLQGTIKETQRS